MTEDQKTAARNEIAELMQRYAHATDFADREGYALLFTEDGVLDLPGGVEHRGREALRNTPKPETLRRRHYFTTPVLTFTSDTEAQGAGYCLLFTYDVPNSDLKPPGSVDYQTSYRKTPEGWRITRQRVRPSFGG
jgi:uncharacterized protein (TIGR02246 family)